MTLLLPPRYTKRIDELQEYEYEREVDPVNPLFSFDEHGLLKEVFRHQIRFENHCYGSFYADINGVKEGSMYVYYPNGNLAATVDFVGDKLNGFLKSYYFEGVLKKQISARYKDGKLHGTFYEYTASGGLLRMEEYNMGVLDGITTLYSYDGKGRKELEFRNGTLVHENIYVGKHHLLSSRNMKEDEKTEIIKEEYTFASKKMIFRHLNFLRFQEKNDSSGIGNSDASGAI